MKAVLAMVLMCVFLIGASTGCTKTSNKPVAVPTGTFKVPTEPPTPTGPLPGIGSKDKKDKDKPADKKDKDKS
jgi:hypothetical protein